MALRRDSLCPQRAVSGILPTAATRDFRLVIAKTRAGSVMVHVTTTHRLAPEHILFSVSPPRCPQPAAGEFRDLLPEKITRRKCPEGAISEGRERESPSSPIRKTPMSSPGKHHIFGPQSRFNRPFFGNRAFCRMSSERHLRQY